MSHAILLMNVRCESSAFDASHLFFPDHRLNLIAETVNASHRPSASDNVLEACQLRS